MVYDAKTLQAVKELHDAGCGDAKIAATLYGVTRHQVRRMIQFLKEHRGTDPHLESISESGDTLEATGVCQARSLEELLSMLDVDLSVWYVDRWVGNQWGKGDMWQVKAWFKRKTHEHRNLEDLIAKLEELGPVVTPLEAMRSDDRVMHRALEISIMDPHMGLRAFKGASGHDYDPLKAEALWWSSIQKLIERSKVYLADMSVFERIHFVAGNDFLHADNVFHTTTQGTAQPEMDAWHHTFERGEELLIQTIEELKKHALFVDVTMVPGNHARQSEYALGRVLKAYYRNDSGVGVQAGPEPYKFWRYGVNLVGYEHGHSIKANRLASLMANEMDRHRLADTWQREWHCGDQHRESAVFSEMGVNIKYLPSMVTWNEWHKIKGFSWAHRASLGFVYDKDLGLIATPQVNARELFPYG